MDSGVGENMTKREIAILSFKVLSLYTVIRVIDQLQYVFYLFANEPVLENLLTKIIPPLLLILCAALLWFLAPFLASSVFKSVAVENESVASLVDIQTVAFTVVGLFLLASALPELVNALIISFTLWVVGSKQALIHTIILLFLKVGLGLWLLFRSRGLVNFLRSVQRN